MNQLEMQWNKMCLLVTITMGQFSSVTGNHQIFIYSRNKHLLLLFFLQLTNLEGIQETLQRGIDK